MMCLLKHTYIVLGFVALLALQACFTGVESTPRITYADVKKQHIEITAEQGFLTDLIPDPPAAWQPGKAFYVTDPKIALIFTSDAPIDTAALAGSDLRLAEVRHFKSLMGEDMAEIDLLTGSGQMLYYKTQIPYEQIDSLRDLQIPFTVDRDYVEKVNQQIKGHTCYIISPLWYDSEGKNSINGLRHVEVIIDEVRPGNANFPLSVVFHQTGSDVKRSVFMTTGSRRTSTRNFDTIFSFDNPKKKYPHITPENWDLIQHSRVKIGMSKDECRLALGAPATSGQRPTTAGMVEYWAYPDGTFLLFEDGFLSSYR